MVPGLGRPHQTLFQFLGGNAAQEPVLGRRKSVVNQRLAPHMIQIRMLLKMICKYKDLREFLIKAMPAMIPARHTGIRDNGAAS
ncbi:hypothetical protein VW29_06525 [Devosia limi DSM 17137]|uniref:Uncharacterized protein n=1 Tax=Devosia limi DSM 17137 TaxID=1121477 RepID=A0A0F5LTG6_9HYPH|nr:hypothetical protein VW29_06525 [Devosia limi DSM 17137]